jgi:hypothetical protein
VNPDDIPTEITKLVYTAPKIESYRPSGELSQNQTAEMLAHFWPAIEAHIRQQVAEEVTAGLTAMHDDPTTAEHYRPGLRGALRNVHRLARA